MCEVKNKCDLCEAPASLQCGACQRVWYCSREHQKRKWREHKVTCIAYRIEDTQSIRGRQLISARDIKQGDLILSSPPCVLGPRLDSPKPSCLACHLILDDDPHPCEGSCGYHLCRADCDGRFHSKEECSLLNAMTVHRKTFEILGILRFALLKTSNPQLYQKLLLLEDHVDQIKELTSGRWDNFENNILTPLKGIKDELEIEDDGELERLVGIWITNSFELDRRGQLISGEKCPGESIQGLYDVPSLMNHDCVGNTRLVINDGFHLDIYASTPIKQKTCIMFNYLSPLDDFCHRQKSLRETKFFDCKCSRCEDPTELGSYSSSLLCQDCKKSPSLRVKDTKNTYECRDCSAVMPMKDLQRIMNSLHQGKNRLHRIGKAWKSCINFLKEYEQILWKSHVFILEIKMALIHIIRGNPSASNMNESAHEFQSSKLAYCQDMIEVQNVIEPGMSLGRGLILHELHSAQVYLANYEFEKTSDENNNDDEPSQQDRMKLLVSLYDALENLMEAWKCLFVEPKSSVLGQRAMVMHTEMGELENYISMVKAI